MKKTILFIFIFILIFSKGFCQNNATLFKTSKIYQNKAIWFQNMPHYNQDSSAFYFEKAIKILQKKPSHFNVELATIYYHRSKFSNVNYSIFSLDSLSKIGWSYLNLKTIEAENKELEYDFLCNWAFIKLELGQNKEALSLFTKAIELSENFKNQDLVAKTLLDKGVFYERYGLDDEQEIAYKNFNKSRVFYEKKNSEKYALQLMVTYRGIISYFQERNKDSVFYYSEKIKSVLKYITEPQKHAYYYVTYGRDLVTYPITGQKTISKKQYEDGKNNILKALAILEQNKITKSDITPYAHGLLADIYRREKKYELAIDYYKKSQKGYEFLKNKRSAIDMNMYIGEGYQLNGDLKTALAYFKTFFNQSITFLSERNERSLRENELKINVINQEKLISKKQNEQIVFIVILFIVLMLLGLLFWNYKQKQKSNKQLAVLNDDLETKNLLLDHKNAENELLLREIHHRVKNNLEIVSSLLALQSAQIDDPNTKEAMTEGQNRVNSIGIVHQKLYQGTNLGAVEMKDYFLNLSESILESFGAESRVDLQLAMENLDLDIDTAVPLGLIVNELLTNCIKYAFPKGENGTITIKLQRQKDNILHLEVADNGIGKSDIIQGTGFGGQLISLLTHQLNGTMTEEIQNGTTIIFDFKLKKSA